MNFNCNLNSWGRLLSAYFQRNILTSRYEISRHFLKACKITETFRKRFWDFDAVLNRHQVADKTTWDKTQQSVDEKKFRWKIWKQRNKEEIDSKQGRNSEQGSEQGRNWQQQVTVNKEEPDSSREGRASELGEYVWFLKLHWKLVDLICEV